MIIKDVISTLEAELAQVEAQLTASVGPASLCSLEKSNQMTRSLKYLEGQQQGFRGALRIWRSSGEKERVLHYVRAERLKTEKMRQGKVGAAGHWPEYLQGSLAALDRIEEIVDTSG